MMKLSIIAPMYNVEKYVGKCLDSLSPFFSDPNIEIIMINDGSSDNTLEIVNDIAKGISNIIVINQKNKGLSGARNVGIAKASGEYLFFLDSDDFIDSNALQYLLKISNNTPADIICGDFYRYDDVTGVSTLDKIHSLANAEICGRPFQVFKAFQKQIGSVVWRSIYKRDLIIKHNLLFKEGVCFEDMLWTPKCYYAATSFKYCQNPFYYYRMRIGSIMNSEATYKKLLDCISIGEELLKFSETISDRADRRFFINSAFRVQISEIPLYKYSLDKDFYKKITGNIKYYSFFSLEWCLCIALNYTPSGLLNIVKKHIRKRSF